MSAINMKISKVLEMFKLGLKSDAVPRAPRAAEPAQESTTPEAHNENVELPEEEDEEIIIESVSDDDIKKEKKSGKKSKNTKFFKSKKRVVDDDDDDDDQEFSKEKRGSASSVNVQATGNVYNIVNAKGVRLGNDYYFGPVTKTEDNNIKKGKDKRFDEEAIEKDNFIKLLMEARIKPDHDFIDYISKNLGKNWHTIFRALGFTQGRIETAEINAAGYDISEARYKLLLDWVNNDDDGTLGRLATLLWEEGERSIVKDLSIMYKKSKK